MDAHRTNDLASRMKQIVCCRNVVDDLGLEGRAQICDECGGNGMERGEALWMGVDRVGVLWGRITPLIAVPDDVAVGITEHR